MTNITEIIPKDMPDWFKQDMEDGQVFARMVKRYDDKEKEIEQLKFELLMVSKLAADEPMFFNPLNAGHAKLIRDRVLKVLQGDQANEL